MALVAYILADLTGRIIDSGASVLAFDIVFAEPDRTSPVVLRRALESRFQVNAVISVCLPNLRILTGFRANPVARQDCAGMLYATGQVGFIR